MSVWAIVVAASVAVYVVMVCLAVQCEFGKRREKG